MSPSLPTLLKICVSFSFLLGFKNLCVVTISTQSIHLSYIYIYIYIYKVAILASINLKLMVHTWEKYPKYDNILLWQMMACFSIIYMENNRDKSCGDWTIFISIIWSLWTKHWIPRNFWAPPMQIFWGFPA